MGSSVDGKFTRYGVEEMGSSGDGELKRRSSEDGEFRKCRVHEMGSLGDG